MALHHFIELGLSSLSEWYTLVVVRTDLSASDITSFNPAFGIQEEETEYWGLVF
jgi:hypothetical protein